MWRASTGNAADANRGRNDQGYLQIDRQPFDSGASRDAYRCRVRNGCVSGFTEGSHCVVKLFQRNRSHLEVSDKDVAMQQYARELAQDFTDECQPKKEGFLCPVLIRDAALTDVLGCSALLEREIRGEFKKFNSNSGWTRGSDPILDTFSHWTWHVTREKILVCDLQGVRGEPGNENLSGQERFYYMLTDPAINSQSKKYGMNDLGAAGIVAFFSEHVCNGFCKKLGLHGHRPPRSAAVRIPIKRSTTYDTEIRQLDRSRRQEYSSYGSRDSDDSRREYRHGGRRGSSDDSRRDRRRGSDDSDRECNYGRRRSRSRDSY